MNISRYYIRPDSSQDSFIDDQNAKSFIITMDGDNSHLLCLNSIIGAWRMDGFYHRVRYEKTSHFKPRQNILFPLFLILLQGCLFEPVLIIHQVPWVLKVNFKRIEKSIKSKGFEFHLELNGKLSKIANNPKPIQINYIKREQGVSKLKYGKEFFGYLKAILWCFIYPKKRR